METVDWFARDRVVDSRDETTLVCSGPRFSEWSLLLRVGANRQEFPISEGVENLLNGLDGFRLCASCQHHGHGDEGDLERGWCSETRVDVSFGHCGLGCEHPVLSGGWEPFSVTEKSFLEVVYRDHVTNTVVGLILRSRTE